MKDDFEDGYEDYEDDLECDCLEADLDILTGIERCYQCGRTRYVSSEELDLRRKQQADHEEEYYRQQLEEEQAQCDHVLIDPSEIPF